MLKLEAQLVFYNLETTQLNPEKFLNHIHVKDFGYWEYCKLPADRYIPNTSSWHLYLKPFDKYSPEEYEIVRHFHIILQEIEKKNFGYCIKFAISLEALNLYICDWGWSPIHAEKWISVKNEDLKEY